jgi:hypothetical protein
MSEPPRPEDLDAAIFRAALACQPCGKAARPDRAAFLFAPGRASLEGAILLAALAVLFPLASPGGMVLALSARRAGNSRWLAAFAAAVWCGLLGGALRTALGLSLVP